MQAIPNPFTVVTATLLQYTRDQSVHTVQTTALMVGDLVADVLFHLAEEKAKPALLKALEAHKNNPGENMILLLQDVPELWHVVLRGTVNRIFEVTDNLDITDEETLFSKLTAFADIYEAAHIGIIAS